MNERIWLALMRVSTILQCLGHRHSYQPHYSVSDPDRVINHITVSQTMTQLSTTLESWTLTQVSTTLQCLGPRHSYQPH